MSPRPPRSQSSDDSKKSRFNSAGGDRKRPAGKDFKGKDSDGGPYRARSEGNEDRPYRSRPARGEERNERSDFNRSEKKGDRPFNKEEKRPYRGRAEEDRSRPSRSNSEDRPKRPYRQGEEGGEKRSYRGREDSGNAKRPYSREGDSERPKRPFNRDDSDRPKRPFSRDDSDRPSRPFNRDSSDRPKRPFSRNGDEASDRPYKRAEDSLDGKRPFRKEGDAKAKRPYEKRSERDRPSSFSKDDTGRRAAPRRDRSENEEERIHTSRKSDERANNADPNALMTLNKYLAHSGVSSRRDAANLVKEGKVSVNGEVVTTPGYRVQPEDVVTLEGIEMKPQRNHVYILLNKPKDYITTTEDDRGRRTVLDLLKDADVGRLYPIGRLDRDTTGVLLLTNDGDLAQKLSHPSNEVKKVYQVTLNKDVTKKDFEAIVAGVELEDGLAVVDEIAYLETKAEIGLQIHNGRNRIVRRIFESLGYEVEKLDRVMFAGLTKKNVSRGKWRFLTDREVVLLKHFKP